MIDSEKLADLHREIAKIELELACKASVRVNIRRALDKLDRERSALHREIAVVNREAGDLVRARAVLDGKLYDLEHPPA